MECAEENFDILEMKAGGGFVENEERGFGGRIFSEPRELGEVADQFQALAFAAGESVDRLTETQVTEADFLKNFEAVDAIFSQRATRRCVG